jgi:hypothetical protein
LEPQRYGEEKPAVDGYSEEAWSKNRRASFVINLGGDTHVVKKLSSLKI